MLVVDGNWLLWLRHLSPSDFPGPAQERQPLKSKRAARLERPDDQNCLKPKIFAAPAAHTRTYNRPWPDCELKAAFDGLKSTETNPGASSGKRDGSGYFRCLTR